MVNEETRRLMPMVLPLAWRPVDSPVRECLAYESMFGLRVLASVEDRGKRTGVWLHVSVSRTARLPTWDDLRQVKDLFFGADRCDARFEPEHGAITSITPPGRSTRHASSKKRSSAELAGAGYRVVAPFLRGYPPSEIPADGPFDIDIELAGLERIHRLAR